MSKKSFAKELIKLKPKLKRTNATPSETTIYSYLNGNREINIELLSYICNVLNISEQELLMGGGKCDQRTQKQLIKYLQFHSNESELLELNSKINKKENILETEIIKLLSYAPSDILSKIKVKLETYKTMSEEF
ncbi:MAG: hypothetical protein GQ570_01590 [Helicobacteraceae bacterium]|nr:hypothetical protein [Helicobacteraceae bacterium]